MKAIFSLAVLCLIFPQLVLGEDPPKAGSIQGTWKVESVIADGEKIKDLKPTGLTFSGSTFVGNGLRTVRGTFKTNAQKSPMTIDLTAKPENGKSETVLGIYKIDGKSLTLCTAEDGKPRPREFESKPGSEITLIVLTKE